jgi:hypothetical protein
MALKKSQLYSKLWQSCDELRGGMDASQYTPRTPATSSACGRAVRQRSTRPPLPMTVRSTNREPARSFGEKLTR